MVSYKTNQNKKVFTYSILLTMLVITVPITSYQEEFDNATDASPRTSIDNIIRIAGIYDNSVSPHTIYIKTNEVLTFINVDGTNGGTAHNVVSAKPGSTEPNNEFDSGLIRAGEVFEVVFTEPGIYEYFDSIYPNIRGTIHVV